MESIFDYNSSLTLEWFLFLFLSSHFNNASSQPHNRLLVNHWPEKQVSKMRLRSKKLQCHTSRQYNQDCDTSSLIKMVICTSEQCQRSCKIPQQYNERAVQYCRVIQSHVVHTRTIHHHIRAIFHNSKLCKTHQANQRNKKEKRVRHKRHKSSSSGEWHLDLHCRLTTAHIEAFPKCSLSINIRAYRAVNQHSCLPSFRSVSSHQRKWYSSVAVSSWNSMEV